MQNRIKIAASKGCDAVDLDNMDGYNNQIGGGVIPALTQADSIAYMDTLSTAASAAGVAIGLKNSLEILQNVSSLVQFAVNEECVDYSECGTYSDFVNSGKPVFHIEYTSSSKGFSNDCLLSESYGSLISTVIKRVNLDSWVKYCDGSTYRTSVLT
jgi:hypothetical protein